MDMYVRIFLNLWDTRPKTVLHKQVDKYDDGPEQ